MVIISSLKICQINIMLMYVKLHYLKLPYYFGWFRLNVINFEEFLVYFFTALRFYTIVITIDHIKQL